MIRSTVAWLGAQFIYLLIRIFGKEIVLDQHPWLAGPFGEKGIGDAPYASYAASEGLTIERNARAGGLIGAFGDLKSESFLPDAAPAEVRHFYEHTALYDMDVWARSFFPANIGLWLLVTTISREVDQLNFPLDALDTAKGMSSEIVLLRGPDGSVRCRGWFRKLTGSDRVLYTGFYMLQSVPGVDGQCVKVVFPMPSGNATVILKPENQQDGSFHLVSHGKVFGGPGFYRLQRFGRKIFVWRISTLTESFRLYVDDRQVLRCDHHVRFLGLPVLSLHYKIIPAGEQKTNHEK